MTVDSNLVPIDPEEYFLLAVERLEAGEALESVLSDFPAEERDALRELLTIVAATHHLQEIDIPRPSPERRVAGKTAFLQAAGAMKAGILEATEDASSTVSATVNLAAGIVPTVSSPPTASSPRVAEKRANVAAPTLGERLGAWWADVVNGILPMTMRMAPLVAMLAAIWLGAFSAVNAAQAAIPGNPVYPAKTWFYAQKLTLSDPEDRPEIYDTYISTLKTDNARAGELALQENKIVYNSANLIIDSVGRSHIEIGGLLIETRYQKSLASEEMTSMAMNGIPVVGAQAYIKYQIVPDPEGAPGATVLQGISLTIEEEPIIIPTAVPTVVATVTTAPTDPAATNGTCTVAPPAGWIAYVVPSGSTVSEIAQQTGTSIPELVRVNCIANPNLVVAGSTLWIPRLPVVMMTPTTVPVTNPSLEVTLTAISTTQPTPVLTVTMPAEGTPTVTITATVIVTSTEAVITPTVETSVTGTVTVVPTTVVTATVVPSGTPTATVVSPTATPLATTVMSETLEATVEETVDSTAVATAATAVTTPTPAGTAVATAVAATNEATAITTAVPVESTTESRPEPTTTPVALVTPSGTPADSNSGGDSDNAEVSGASGGESTEPPETSGTAPPTATVAPTIATEAVGRSGGNARPRPVATATPTPVNRSPLGKGD